MIKINIFSHDISKSFKKKLNKNNENSNPQRDEINNNNNKSLSTKIALPNRIKTCKYLIHFITLILEIRSHNIESFDKTSKTNSNSDNNRKDSINDKVLFI